MGLPRGKTIPLSPMRRLMDDFLHLSRKVPLVAIERRMDLSELIRVRKRSERRPSWFALFLKAYAQVAWQREELRRSFLSFPRPRLHQHLCNVATLAVARRVDGEEGVLGLRIRRPEQRPLWEIDAIIRRARTAPVHEIGVFSHCLRLSRLPRFVRRLLGWFALNVSGDLHAKHAGTFGITGVGALGSAAVQILSPLTTTITYGVFEADGSIPVRLFFDHRVLDGLQAAAALESLEAALNGSIRSELAMASRRAAWESPTGDPVSAPARESASDPSLPSWRDYP